MDRGLRRQRFSDAVLRAMRSSGMYHLPARALVRFSLVTIGFGVPESKGTNVIWEPLQLPSQLPWIEHII
jgi:hypothetical protein